MRLRDFDTLTFDCYGTLIDWESGIVTALQPLLARLDRPPRRDAVLEAFGRHETRLQQAHPAMRYSELLGLVHQALAEEFGLGDAPEESRRFGSSVADWPAFPDSAAALRYLQQHYRLVVLSNVDRDSFKASNARLGVVFDAVYTAEDIGCYKPDPRTFAYLLEQLSARGIEKSQILHTAQSLFHDHVPANAADLASAWIDRRHEASGWGATAAPAAGVHYDFRFTSLDEMTRAHRAEQG